MRIKFSYHAAALNPLVVILTETLAPGTLFVWGKYVFFPPNNQDISAAKAELFVFVAILWIVWYIVFKKVRGTWLRRPQMELRQVLLHVRNVSSTHTQKIRRLCAQITDKELKKDEVLACLREALDFDETIRYLLQRLFHTFSAGNHDLQHHFRVTLMEPEGDSLKIKYWANSENDPPRCYSLGLGFERGEGSAGWAWKLMKPFILEDLDVYRKKLKKKKKDVEPSYFLDLHEEQKGIKSVVSMPVVVRGPAEEDMKAVLTIDTDVKGFFRETEKGERDIRIRSYPIIRSIALTYQARDLIESLA